MNILEFLNMPTSTSLSMHLSYVFLAFGRVWSESQVSCKNIFVEDFFISLILYYYIIFYIITKSKVIFDKYLGNIIPGVCSLLYKLTKCKREFLMIAVMRWDWSQETPILQLHVQFCHFQPILVKLFKIDFMTSWDNFQHFFESNNVHSHYQCLPRGTILFLFRFEFGWSFRTQETFIWTL